MTLSTFVSESGLLRSWHLRDRFGDGRLQGRLNPDIAFHRHPYEQDIAGTILAARSRPEWYFARGTPRVRNNRLYHDFDTSRVALWTASNVTIGEWEIDLRYLDRDYDGAQVEFWLVADASENHNWRARLWPNGRYHLLKQNGDEAELVIDGRWPSNERDNTLKIRRNRNGVWQLLANNIGQGRHHDPWLPTAERFAVHFRGGRSTRVGIDGITIR